MGSPGFSSTNRRRCRSVALVDLESAEHADEHDTLPSWSNGQVHYLRILSVTNLFALAGTILGVALLATCAISVAAIVQKSHVTIGLVILNYALLLDAIGIVIIGTFVWFFTLQERSNFHRLWLQASPQTRTMLQDQVCHSFHLLVNVNNFVAQMLRILQRKWSGWDWRLVLPEPRIHFRTSNGRNDEFLCHPHH